MDDREHQNGTRTHTYDERLDNDDVIDLTCRPSYEYNTVVQEADYTKRAALSFYRFRQLGGDFRMSADDESDSQTPAKPKKKNAYRKLRLGESTGRGINYVSSHVESRFLQFSIIALMILFESAANAYFFAKQSEFGLAGGIFQAAAVSVANVAVSFLIIGYWGLRHISMPWDREKLTSRRNLFVAAGVVAVAVGFYLVLLVNLSAAHYRNILDLQALDLSFPADLPTQTSWYQNPFFLVEKGVCDAILGEGSNIGSTIGSAATNAMCRPFALHSLDAMVLFALGMSISIFAAFEGRRLDSPFPGFSDAARQLERQRGDLLDSIDEYLESFEDVVEDIESINGAPLTPKQKVLVSKKMAERMEPYRDLLRTSNTVLSDEFGVEMDVVKEFIEKSPEKSS